MQTLIKTKNDLKKIISEPSSDDEMRELANFELNELIKKIFKTNII